MPIVYAGGGQSESIIGKNQSVSQSISYAFFKVVSDLTFRVMKLNITKCVNILSSLKAIHIKGKQASKTIRWYDLPFQSTTKGRMRARDV